MRVKAVRVMSKRELWILRGFWLLWIIANFIFWSWWFDKERYVFPVLFALTTLALMYESTFLPSVFLFLLSQMKRPVGGEIPKGLRVAVVTAVVPSKEADVLEGMLQSMRNMNVPPGVQVDFWVLDEERDPRVQRLAKKYGVNYFSRAGIPKYNAEDYPWKKGTKAGNYNSWLDFVGWKKYDILVQLDVDHYPKPNFLEKVLPFFADPTIGWVQGPSIYGNLDPWTSRGAAEQELVLQGPLQMGFFGLSGTPVIIGSHTAFRIEALRKIGGFSETRAEDHLNTVKLTATEYKGVFVPEIIAVGMGPEDFATYLKQQFAWALSLVQIFFFYAPKFIRRMSLKEKFQFLFMESWYLLWSLSYFVLYILPSIALLLNISLNVPFLEFLIRYEVIVAIGFLVYWWSRKWFQPPNLFLSWRAIVLNIARWPIVLWAVVNAILKIKHPYMITPKNKRSLSFSLKDFLRVHSIYLAFSGFSIFSIVYFLVRFGSGAGQGYLFFALEGSLMMMSIPLTSLIMEIKERMKQKVSWRPTLSGLLTIGSLLLIISLCALRSGGLIFEALFWKPVVKEPTPYPIEPLPTELPETPTPQVLSSFLQNASPTPEIPLATLPSLAISPTPTPSLVAVTELPAGIVWGVYDPSKSLVNVPGIYIEHEFFDWRNLEDLDETIKEILERGHVPLITIEPYPLPGDDNLLENILAGRYDSQLLKVARVIRAHDPNLVLLRWGHEMDLTGLYPWSTDQELYKAAYEYVVSFVKKEGTRNVRWVWSPAGTLKAIDFLPKEGVDFVGITILEDPGWNQLNGLDGIRSFSQLLEEKYWLASLGHPIIITELGVSVNQEEWLREATTEPFKERFPLLKGIVYFNAINAHAPAGIRPDWRIPRQVFEAIVNNR